MGYSKSLLAYPDVKGYLDHALNTSNGISIQFETEKNATRFIARANMFRVLDRKENKLIYAEGHSLHGRSPYDVLYIAQRGSLVLVEIMKPILANITELPDEEGPTIP